MNISLPTLFRDYDKEAQVYKTQKNEEARFKALSGGKRANTYIEARPDSIRNEVLPLLNQPHLFAEGEFATVERQYRETGFFDFTARGDGKIRSYGDVAFIFRQLESEGVEHAFAVYVDKDKDPTVQWLSMGATNATVVDLKLMMDAAAKLQPEEIYFVHNHPSGNLLASNADKAVLQLLQHAFEPRGIKVQALIINLQSGRYAVFDDKDSYQNKAAETEIPYGNEKKVTVLSFDRQAFLQSPQDITKIRSNRDVATFLSQQRFAAGKKSGWLLLNQGNNIVGNFFQAGPITDENLPAVSQRVANLASRFGAVSVIGYGNELEIKKQIPGLKTMLGKQNFNLMDYIVNESSPAVQQNFVHYTSMADEGILQEALSKYKLRKDKVIFPTLKINKMDTENPKKDTSGYVQDADTYDVQKVQENQEKNNLDFLAKQLKYLGFGEGLNEAVKSRLDKGESFTLSIDQSYHAFGKKDKDKTQEVTYALQFDKNETSNLFYLNAYQAKFKNTDAAPMRVHLTDGKGFTAKEAFNLLSGRAIRKDLKNKEGGKYNAWVKFNPIQSAEKNTSAFDIFHQNYGYDIEKEIGKLKLKDSSPEAKVLLKESLQKGNIQIAQFDVSSDMPSSLFLEANPKFKTIQLYFEDGRQVPLEKIEQYKNIEPKQEIKAEPDSNREQTVKLNR